jgi:hypothetical protein
MHSSTSAHRDVGFERGAAPVSGGKHHEHQHLHRNDALYHHVHLKQHMAVVSLRRTASCCRSLTDHCNRTPHQRLAMCLMPLLAIASHHKQGCFCFHLLVAVCWEHRRGTFPMAHCAHPFATYSR